MQNKTQTKEKDIKPFEYTQHFTLTHNEYDGHLDGSWSDFLDIHLKRKCFVWVPNLIKEKSGMSKKIKTIKKVGIWWDLYIDGM